MQLLLGAVLPIVCLIFDPIVFRTNPLLISAGDAVLSRYRVLGYVATLLAVIVFTRACFTGIKAIEAGMLYGAALVSFALGVVLLPYSFFGLFFGGVGLLGLSPFVASWIYLRHGARNQTAGAAAALGLVLFVAVAAAAQLSVNGAVHRAVARGSPPPIILRPLYDWDELVWKYQASTSLEEQQRLAIVYRGMTGHSLEERVASLSD